MKLPWKDSEPEASHLGGSLVPAFNEEERWIQFVITDEQGALPPGWREISPAQYWRIRAAHMRKGALSTATTGELVQVLLSRFQMDRSEEREEVIRASAELDRELALSLPMSGADGLIGLCGSSFSPAKPDHDRINKLQKELKDAQRRYNHPNPAPQAQIRYEHSNSPTLNAFYDRRFTLQFDRGRSESDKREMLITLHSDKGL